LLKNNFSDQEDSIVSLFDQEETKNDRLEEIHSNYYQYDNLEQDVNV